MDFGALVAKTSVSDTEMNGQSAGNMVEPECSMSESTASLSFVNSYDA